MSDDDLVRAVRTACLRLADAQKVVNQLEREYEHAVTAAREAGLFVSNATWWSGGDGTIDQPRIERRVPL